jgi:hypothetical protein
MAILALTPFGKEVVPLSSLEAGAVVAHAPPGTPH